VSGVISRVDGHVAYVTLNRPDVLNAIDPATHAELEVIWDGIEKDRAIRVVVLTGAGDRAFCVGDDMKAEDSRTGLEYWAHPKHGGFGALSLRQTLDVPVIAAVNGYALGGGLEMMLACDIVVAVEDAKFGLPEPRVGRVPLDGGPFHLVRQLPFRSAMGLLLTGRQVGAAEALRLGLINEVVPRPELDAAVDRWVTQVLACAPLALRAIKQMIHRAARLPIDEAMRVRLPALMEALQSSDADEGVRAFVERRTAQWQGR
jgi:enoyl-CoA hydratase/carnithine racemase